MRGRTWCQYITDDNVSYALEVDSDHALDPIRGWNTQNVFTRSPLPRGWLPRVVVGTDVQGHTVRTRVGNTVCDLWTGRATSFTFEASDLTIQTATVIARLGERTGRRPPPTS